jgi:hypothetical protein
MSPLWYPAKARAPRSLIVVSIRLVPAAGPGQASHESYRSKTISISKASEVFCWSGVTNIPLISRDIELCAQKVEPWISRESHAVRSRGPRSLSGALAGRIMGKNSGRLELTDWR